MRRLALVAFLLAACQPLPGTVAPSGDTGEAKGAIAGLVAMPRRLAFAGEPTPDPERPAPTPRPSGPELPAAGAEVFVSDARGTRVPGVPATQTNADGRYYMGGVPLGYAFVVTAVYRDDMGRPTALRTLARSADGVVDAPIDTATTLVVAAAVPPAAGLVGGYDAAAFARAVQGFKARLAGDYPDLGDAFVVTAEVARIQAADAALAADVAALRAPLLPAASPSPSPSPSSTPTPTTAVTPAP